MIQAMDGSAPQTGHAADGDRPQLTLDFGMVYYNVWVRCWHAFSPSGGLWVVSDCSGSS
jgi:hypothetical protein